MMTQAVSPNAATSTSLTTDGLSRLHWQRSPGMNLAVLDCPRFRELRLTLTPKAGETVNALVGRLTEVLKQDQALVVQQFVFGSVAAHAETLDAMRRLLGDVGWPVTWVEGASCAGGPIAGMQIHAVAGAPVHTLTHDGRLVGRVFDDGEAKHCLLGDLGSVHAAAAAPEQARETFEKLEAALGLAGMMMNDVVRTWFFLDDILSWYGPFNEIRNAFFARNQLQPGLFPASTGVAGKNPRGTALVAGAWSFKPHNSNTRVHTVPSPAQCPATRYGSAFSRAVEIVSPHCRRLLLSGTASVAPDGQTAHVGDAPRQIELTMEAVGAILQSRGLTLPDATRATAYFKSAVDFPLFTAWCIRGGHDALPVVSACSDLCRPDLLFEDRVRRGEL